MQLQVALAKAKQSGRGVVVDFSAPWCGPCKKIAPDFHRLAQTWSHSIDFFTVNVDNAEELVSHFDVRSVPVFLFFKDNKVIDTQKGADLKTLVEKVATLGTNVTNKP